MQRRGKKEDKDLPPAVCVTYKNVKKHISIHPGMDVAGLTKALQYLFKKELGAYGKDPYDIIGVEFDNEADHKELVPLDVLAKAPAVVLANPGAQDVALVVSPDPKPKPPDLPVAVKMLLLSVGVLTAFIVRTALLRPLLRKLYRTGPAYRFGFGTVGFWQGAPLAAICASLTGAQDSSFWERNRKQCIAIFGQKEESFLVALETLVILTALYLNRKAIKDTAATLPASAYKYVTALTAAKTATDKYNKLWKSATDVAQGAHRTEPAQMVLKGVAAAAALFASFLFIFYGPISPYPS